MTAWLLHLPTDLYPVFESGFSICRVWLVADSEYGQMIPSGLDLVHLTCLAGPNVCSITRDIGILCLRVCESKSVTTESATRAFVGFRSPVAVPVNERVGVDFSSKDLSIELTFLKS